MTFTLGTWAIPLAITLLLFVAAIWLTTRPVEASSDIGAGVGKAIAFIVSMALAVILSLLAWLVWALV